MKRVLALSLSIATMASVASFAAGSTTKINGWVSDAMCGAKHTGSGAACVKKCIGMGEKPVFVDDTKKQVWAIDNPDAVKGVYGEHVTIMATANAATKTVHIASVKAMTE
uniref:Uncharacterized protein n=1 Tax=mine drainage metagenome TaxID=410659 RepID=E6QI83_9ZZZZ